MRARMMQCERDVGKRWWLTGLNDLLVVLDRLESEEVSMVEFVLCCLDWIVVDVWGGIIPF
jgi:hypothetical protein